MDRPDHLPDFKKPPVDEVVLGAQFEPVPNFSPVNFGEIWALFQADFPKVQEQHLLNPRFETFGGGNPQPGVRFQIEAQPIVSRLWFLSEDESHLLQFQSDRFIANWRKRPTNNEYPRFEGIAEAYTENLYVLAKHFAESFNYELKINQSEIAYINIIPVAEFSDVGDWISLWDNSQINPEALNTNFSEIVLDEGGRPFARLIYEIQSAFSSEGKFKVFKLSISFRGKPSGSDIKSAMDFIKIGREKIVTRFTELTTQKAHETWDRKK